jgi:predicted GH43/DUF377 family glycosyl hydrolase
LNELLVKGKIHKPRNPYPDQWAFNPGMVEIWGRTLIVYRVGRQPSIFAVSELDKHYQPTRSEFLFDFCSQDHVPEDPRLIAIGDHLYLLYAGVKPDFAGQCWMYWAELGRDYKVISRHRCEYEPRCSEKNWVPFVNQKGMVVCIYNHYPFTILKYGRPWRLHHAHEVEWGWQYGEIRGGANPVKHNGLWYHIFHSNQQHGKVKVYYVGAYVFDDNYNIRAITREPIMSGNVKDWSNPWNGNGGISAVFPCGAIVRDDRFVISYGYLDSECRIAEIPTTEIDKRLHDIHS